MTHLSKVKQNTQKHTDNAFNLKTTKRQRALWTIFVNCVRWEVTYWQYEPVLIIFPLDLQTITIALDAVKMEGRSFSFWSTDWLNSSRWIEGM